MKPLDELDHYEVLEVPPDAGFEDIERAYRMTRAAYIDGSMALYSIFDQDDAAVIRSRIDEAYRVLANPEIRAKYDSEAGFSSVLPGASTEAPPIAKPAASNSTSVAGEHVNPGTAELASAIEVIDDLDAEIDEGSQEINGAALRRARLRRGIELDQITDVTKIRVGYLRCIENEEIEKLPASVYIRGFVHAYARAIGLDADRAAANYMARVDAVRNPPRRSLRSTAI
jgi:curved DNA-binding protein CbpA